MRWHPGVGLAGATATTLAVGVAVWALTGSPPSRPVDAAGAARGDGWTLTGAALTSPDTVPPPPAADGSRFVVVTFQLTVADAAVAGELRCSVEFTSGAKRWRPDGAVALDDHATSCYQLQPGVPTAIGFSTTVPATDAGAIRAELTIGRTPAEPQLVWFGGEAVVSIPG